MKKKTFDRINIYAKMNLISYDFIQILKLFLCINVQVINVQKINDKTLKKQVVYFVRFVMIDTNETTRYFKKSFFDVNFEWQFTLDRSWIQFVDVDTLFNWNIDDIKQWFTDDIDDILHITKWIEMIVSKKIIETLLNENKTTYLLIIWSWDDDLNKIHIFRRVLISNAIASSIKNVITFISKCLKYYENINIESEKKTYILSEHDFTNHVIDFINDTHSSYNFIYFLFEKELKMFKTYIDKHLIIDFIKHFQSFVDAFVLFASKFNESFRFCIDYRDLNELTIKNRYLLFFIKKSLNRFVDVKRYTKLNFMTVYHRLKIKKGDEWKTTFRTRYEHFEYNVFFFFDFTNASITFQGLINKIFAEKLNVFVIVYLNDIVIYSVNEKKHIEHVKWMLNRFFENKLFIVLEKCEWFDTQINFLNFIISSENVRMQSKKVEIIRQWFASAFVNEI